MKRQLTAAAVKDYTEAPPAVRRAFDKQVKLLLENFRHPSLRFLPSAYCRLPTSLRIPDSGREQSDSRW
jgi:hypothetical protein